MGARDPRPSASPGSLSSGVVTTMRTHCRWLEQDWTPGGSLVFMRQSSTRRRIPVAKSAQQLNVQPLNLYRHEEWARRGNHLSESGTPKISWPSPRRQYDPELL